MRWFWVQGKSGWAGGLNSANGALMDNATEPSEEGGILYLDFGLEKNDAVWNSKHF